MDFPIITSGSPNPSFWEREEQLPQINPEAPPLQRIAPAQTIFIKGYTPGNKAFIDVEFHEVAGQGDLTYSPPNGLDRPLRNAMHVYYRVARGKKSKQHTIDLYV